LRTIHHSSLAFSFLFMARRVLASISRKRTGFPWDATRCFVGLFAIPADRNRISAKWIGKVSLISPLRPVTTERVEHSRNDLGRGAVQRLAPLLAPALRRRFGADRFGCSGNYIAKPKANWLANFSCKPCLCPCFPFMSWDAAWDIDQDGTYANNHASVKVDGAVTPKPFPLPHTHSQKLSGSKPRL
jgi:hypothetical protein